MKLVTYLNPDYKERRRTTIEQFSMLVSVGGEERLLDVLTFWTWLEQQFAANSKLLRYLHSIYPAQNLGGLLDRSYRLNDQFQPVARADDWMNRLHTLLTIFNKLAETETDLARSMSLDPASVQLLAPLRRPNSIRDFYAFREHVETARRNRGLPMIEEWFQFPAFYFTNHNAVIGPDVPLRMPRTTALDYELEIACVIGRPGRDIAAEDAPGYIAGYMIMNDWSARDVQPAEMKVGLGPAKAKDFATSLGPYLVTPDELADRRVGEGAEERYDLRMTARVNGELRSGGNLRDIHYSFSQLIAHASRDVWLYPGDVIASGTVGTGCLLELTAGQGPWLQPGDVVELEVERLGVLRNEVQSEK